MEKRERLSSLLTFFYRIIFPVVWVTGFGSGAIAVMAGNLETNPPMPLEMKLFMFFGWILFSIYIIWHAFVLRNVWLENDHIIVSNMNTEQRIPLSLIDKITETRFSSPKIIKLVLKPHPSYPHIIRYMSSEFFQISFADDIKTKHLRKALEEIHKNA